MIIGINFTGRGEDLAALAEYRRALRMPERMRGPLPANCYWAAPAAWGDRFYFLDHAAGRHAPPVWCQGLCDTESDLQTMLSQVMRPGRTVIVRDVLVPKRLLTRPTPYAVVAHFFYIG